VTGVRVAVAIGVDVLGILIFVVVGRVSHGEAADPTGILGTAWPFLTGALLGWLAGRVWRHPRSVVAGAIIWFMTWAGGIALRDLSGAGVQPSFVIVAAIVLGAVLVGWRAGCAGVHRARVALSS
jgi:peptidoglycan/LPS O-acetylase OafA/YrhL